MLYNIEKIKEEIDNIYDQVVCIRRHIHKHPELSEHEVSTSKFIMENLDKLNISYESNIAGYGIVATIFGKDKDHASAIRADIDALPITEKTSLPFASVNEGVMHGCGHDMHTAMLLGAAMILNNMKDSLPYSVKLLFQPSEETVGGAAQMIEAGCLKNPQVSTVIGTHIEPETPCGKIKIIPGPMNAASCEFSVKVLGKSCHGAHPDNGIDPLLPACTMVTSLQSIITRKINPAEAALITVGKFSSGTKDNIIPSEAEFHGIIRTFSLQTRDLIKDEIKKLCENTALAYGALAQVEFFDSYPSLENDLELFNLTKAIGETALGEENVLIGKIPSLGADDFAYFCHGSRGMYIDIGCKKEGVESYPLHSEFLSPEEECMKTGILMEVLSTLEILEKESKENGK